MFASYRITCHRICKHPIDGLILNASSLLCVGVVCRTFAESKGKVSCDLKISDVLSLNLFLSTPLPGEQHAIPNWDSHDSCDISRFVKMSVKLGDRILQHTYEGYQHGRRSMELI